MFLATAVLVPAVATADTGGTNTIRVIPATSTVTPVGSGSFFVDVVANGSVAISGAGAGLDFDSSTLVLDSIALNGPSGVSYAGIADPADPDPNVHAAYLQAIADFNTAGAIGNISFFRISGSNAANTAVNVYRATFHATGSGDSSLVLTTSTILDGRTTSYGASLDPVTTFDGTVVNHSAPVFSISNNGPATVNRGASTTVTISTGVVTGSPGTIALGISGLPSGVTHSFGTNPVAAGSSSILTLTASGAATTGTFSITVTGVDSADAADTQSTSFNLTVVAPNDFSIAATPPTVTVSAGGSAQTTSISVAQLTPTIGTVNLSVTSAAIPNVTTVLTGGSAVPGSPDTLTITAASGAAAGSYTVTVTGNNGTNSHAVNISLTVNGAAAANQQDVNVTGVMDNGFIALTCPTSLAMPLIRGNTNSLNVPCVVATNTIWNLNVGDTATDADKGYMVTGRPVDNVTKFRLPDSMHVLSGAFISNGDVFYTTDVNLVTGGTILTGTNSANAPVVLSQFVSASAHSGAYSIQLTFTAMSVF